MGQSLPTKTMVYWNSGLSLEEAVHKPEFSQAEWNHYVKTYGEACIPVNVLIGYRLKEETDPLARSHRGLDGKGLLLKQIVAAAKAEMAAEGEADLSEGPSQ